MARGWESKSVEEQIEAARERRGEARPHKTIEQIETERKREALELQRTRVLRNLDNCRDERYRKTLSDGLAYLDARISELR